MAVSEIEQIQKHSQRIISGQERVAPGMPYRISEAAQAGDGVWQGDLGIEIVDAVPEGYELVKKPTAKDMQLVPGNTTGSKHVLDSLVGVKLYRPKQWTEESLQGPCLKLAKERSVTHPTHGAVTIPAGLIVVCRYQREFDKEQQRERRARD